MADELGDLSLELLVQVESAADEPHRGHAVAVLVQRCMCRFYQYRAVGQPKVVVGAEVQDVVARFDRDVGALGRCDHALGFVEPGVSDRLDFGFEVLQEGAGHGSILDVEVQTILL